MVTAKEQFEPIYDFVRTHRRLFDDYQAVEQVALVFTQPSANPTSALKHATESLVNLNVPFGLLVAGNEWVPNRLLPAAADRFEVLLLAAPVVLDAAQQRAVDEWKKRRPVLTVAPTDDVSRLLSGRIDPLVAIDGTSPVRLFPRAIPGNLAAPVVCHLVNWGYDAATNLTPPQQNVRLRLRTALARGARVTRVTYHTIGKPAQTLEYAVRGDVLHVTVPEIALWSVLELERN